MTDLLMPGMTGWEVLRALRRLDPKIPVVIVTGADVWAGDCRILQPAVALVRKPVDMGFSRRRSRGCSAAVRGRFAHRRW